MARAKEREGGIDGEEKEKERRKERRGEREIEREHLEQRP